jgi:hypothetical protein
MPNPPRDDEARQRYIRLEQMYLQQMAVAEEQADSQRAVPGEDLKPAAA